MEIMAIPENDNWVYKRGPAWVCTSFVLDILKAGGVFEDIDI